MCLCLGNRITILFQYSFLFPELYVEYRHVPASFSRTPKHLRIRFYSQHHHHIFTFSSFLHRFLFLHFTRHQCQAGNSFLFFFPPSTPPLPLRICAYRWLILPLSKTITFNFSSTLLFSMGFCIQPNPKQFCYAVIYVVQA
jgi:hypothetical protein